MIDEPKITVVVDGWKFRITNVEYREDGAVTIQAEPKKGYVSNE